MYFNYLSKEGGFVFRHSKSVCIREAGTLSTFDNLTIRIIQSKDDTSNLVTILARAWCEANDHCIEADFTFELEPNVLWTLAGLV